MTHSSSTHILSIPRSMHRGGPNMGPSLANKFQSLDMWMLQLDVHRMDSQADCDFVTASLIGVTALFDVNIHFENEEDLSTYVV